MDTISRPDRENSSDPAPFWNRVPLFFLFPLNLSVLGRICLFGAMPAVAIFATSIPMIVIAFGGLSLLAWIFFLRQGSRVLSETARGRLSPADYDWEPDPSLAYQPFKIIGLFFITSFVVSLAASMFGETAGFVANFVVMAMIPAAIMVLVHQRSLFAALNPAEAWTLIRTIGKPYLLLCLFLFCLSSAQMFMTYWIAKGAVMPIVERWGEVQEAMRHVQSDDGAEHVQELMENLQSFMGRQRPRLALLTLAFTAVGMYFTMIAFNMMGYVLYQYHRPLGLDVDEPRGRRGGAPEPRDEESDQIAALIAAGQLDKALDIAYEAQRVDPESLPAQERYHKLLHLAGKTDRLLPHANRFIGLLLRKSMPAKALEALRRCREKEAEYRPEDPATVLALAQAARSTRDAKFALEILRGFDKAHPRHPLIPEVYSLSARILCEDMRQDAMADRLFAAILERYPDHPCAAQAQEYRTALARMQTQDGAQPS